MGENRRKTRVNEEGDRAHEYNTKFDKRINSYYCLICNKMYKHKHEIGQHMRNVHRKYNTVFKRYSLADNQAKTTKPLKDLVKRQNKAANKLPLKRFREVRGSGTKQKENKQVKTDCLLCNKSFSSKAYLKNHYKTEHPRNLLNKGDYWKSLL